jgi:guanylate kinase
VVNDKLEKCVEEVHGLVEAARRAPVRQKAFIKEIREELQRFTKGAE